MSEQKFSQSLFKNLLEYQKGEMCGLVFKQKWIYGINNESTQVQDYGHYFEFHATGSLPKNMIIPKPKFYKKGERKGEITDGYSLAKQQAEYFKQIIKDYKVKILNKGLKIEFEDYEGTLDIVASFPMFWELQGLELPENNKNGIVIIDLKYSGLLDDRKNPFGWEIKSFPYKLSPKIQSIHYSWLYKKKFGFAPPFMFWVFDSAKLHRARIINCDINENIISQHEEIVAKAKTYYAEMKKNDSFEPKPEYERCYNCNLKNSCSFKYTVPPIINVNFE
jgi:hypothetical protein